MANVFQYGRICYIFLQDLGENKSVYVISAERPELLQNMSGILDPRIPPFRRSAYNYQDKRVLKPRFKDNLTLKLWYPSWLF